MSYFEDLSPCTYFDESIADKLVAVGWLDSAYPYTQGKLDENIIDKLFELLIEPWAPSYFMGYEECSFCDLSSYRMSYNGKTIRVGNLNLFVPGDGFLYVAPSLIAHYISVHNYAPPQEFCDAVLRCPPMGSIEYYRAIAANGPQRYIDLVKAKYLANG